MAEDSAVSGASRKSSLLRRTAIGALLGGLVFAVVFYSRPGVALLVAAWAALAALEFLGLLARAEIKLNRWLVPLLCASLPLAGYFGWLPGFIIAPLAIVFIAAVMARGVRPRVPVYGSFALLYIGFLPSHLVLLKNLAWARHLSPWLVFFPLAVTWLNDTAALLVGRAWGRRKLAPALSPNKTMEGFLAGLVASALFSAAVLHRLAPFAAEPVWWLAIVGIGMGSLAQAGDLFESIFKRAVAVKDTSSVLADHGGFLDRVDSLLFTIPAFFYLVRHLL